MWVVPSGNGLVFKSGRDATPSNEPHALPVKICIVSDSHDRAEPLLAALEAARREGAELAIHCGDVIGTQTLRPLLELDMTIHVVHGNNIGDAVSLNRLAVRSQGRLIYHGLDADLSLHGKRVYVTHYPHQARGLACTGDYDLVCCGHSHEASVARQPDILGGQTWLVNPGTVAGVGAAASWIFGDLRSMHFEIRS